MGCSAVKSFSILIQVLRPSRRFFEDLDARYAESTAAGREARRNYEEWNGLQNQNVLM